MLEDIEKQLSHLNVFSFFQSIFQADVLDGKNVQKGYVFCNPMVPNPWGREQAKIPIHKPEKYVDGVLQKECEWSLVDLALDGYFWKDQKDSEQVKDPKY